MLWAVAVGGSVLSLLHQMLEMKALQSFLSPLALLTVVRYAVHTRPHASPPQQYLMFSAVSLVCSDILIPNCVWRAGKVATAMRLQVFVVFNALFSHRLIDSKLLTGAGLRAALMSPLQTNLDDDEVSVRLEVVRVMQHVFALCDATSRFGDEKSTTDLYSEVLKRLDDSNDAMRLHAMKALGLLVTRGFPPGDNHTTHQHSKTAV